MFHNISMEDFRRFKYLTINMHVVIFTVVSSINLEEGNYMLLQHMECPIFQQLKAVFVQTYIHHTVIMTFIYIAY